MEKNKMIEDFIKVQQNLPKVKKEGKGNYGKYLKLDDIMPLALDILNKNNFVLLQAPSVVDGHPALRTSIVHVSGEQVESTMLLMLDKETAQGQGSAITYARRYSLASILGLVADEDDDGQKATDVKSFAPKNPTKHISEAQVKLVIARLKQKGATSIDEANTIVYDLIGKDSVAQVLMGEMDELLKAIDTLPDGENQ